MTRKASWPSVKQWPVTCIASPATRLTAKRPPSTDGSTASTTARTRPSPKPAGTATLPECEPPEAGRATDAAVVRAAGLPAGSTGDFLVAGLLFAAAPAAVPLLLAMFFEFEDDGGQRRQGQ